MQKISHENGNPDAWICVCGNRPDADGFLVCDAGGNEIEPDCGWAGLYLCNRCGVIIDQQSLNMVGRAQLVRTP